MNPVNSNANNNYQNRSDSNTSLSLEQQLELLRKELLGYSDKKIKDIREKITAVTEKLTCVQKISKLLKERIDQSDVLDMNSNNQRDLFDLIEEGRKLGLKLTEKTKFTREEVGELENNLVQELTQLQSELKEQQQSIQQAFDERKEFMNLIMNLLQKIAEIIAMIIKNIGRS